MSTVGTQPFINDAQERAQALDPHASFLVQAPAGSGKTELLTLRYLALLPQVEQPEQILAITFTRKATAEMRVRVLRALERGRGPEPGNASEHERTMRRLAQAALAHSEAQGWNLIEQPQRLNIQTIDSLALSIASRLPMLSRMNGQLTPIDDAGALHALAAQRTMARLGDAARADLTEALSEILRLRDVNLADCAALIARMLAQRDQWLLALPEVVQSGVPWERLRTMLEEPFRNAHARALADIQAEFVTTPEVIEELLALGRTAYSNKEQSVLLPVHDLHRLEHLTGAAHWLCIGHLLLTQEGKWRTSISATIGFPAKTHRNEGERLKAIIEQLSGNDALQRFLHGLRTLPPDAYTPEEARTVRSVFTVLRHAIAELRVVFAEQGVIDFAEAGIGARAALEIPGVRMRLDEQVHHLLVDEFQDTSRPHFALLQMLLDEWQPGEGRTCFLVGDPMQSIYLFRDADPRLFSRVRERGFELAHTSLPLIPIQLSTNFRSLPAIVEPLNGIFERVLEDDPEQGVELAHAVSSRGEAVPGDDAVRMHIELCEPTDSRSPTDLRRIEADQIITIIRAHEEEMRAAQRDGGKFRIAILARNRSHLAVVIERLQQEGIPFRGVKVHHLRERQEIIDLLSLLRALLHPADRIAWLAVLRAPWCGLTLPALHALCGDEEDKQSPQTIAALLRSRAEMLDAESRRRALHVLHILDDAQDAYANGALAASPVGLALWLERTWHALGAPLYLSEEARSNCEAFFSALATVPSGCFGSLDPALERQLKDLFAQPDPSVSEDCGVQLMTIHQAKGLEFEVVLVPQLHGRSAKDDAPLFQWILEEAANDGREELLLAPIGYKHDEALHLYEWVRRKVQRRLHQEAKRLLYVACSRAIRELHLFAVVQRNKTDGQLAKPALGSLLRAGWAGLETRVLAAIQPSVANNVVSMPSPAAPSGVMESIAAGAEPPSQSLRRLPVEHFSEIVLPPPAPVRSISLPANEAGISSRLARVQGVVLHALLERAAAAGAAQDWPKIADALLRQHGLAAQERESAHSAVLRGIHNALAHEEGRWLLMPRETAAWTEGAWSTVQDGRVTRQRTDRVFLGGDAPGAPGTDCLWIVDYKTAPLPEDVDRERFVRESREQYQPQLERYSTLFRRLTTLDSEAAMRPHRLAIYHPMLPWLDWWPAE